MKKIRRVLSLGLLFLGTDARAWTPGTGTPTAVNGFVVDTTNRNDVLSFYNCIYTASEGYPARLTWTGNTTSGIAGTTGATFKDDVRRRINFYRALSSLPADITFDTAVATKSAKDQEAALMMARNNSLSHEPPTSWLSYTANGAEAAGKSNLARGVYGPGAVDGYMEDPGSGNEIVGHRRWLTYLRAADMGTGDVSASGSFFPANAIWVIGDFKASATAQFVSWPNAGFVALPLLPDRWSLSYPGANFAAATVTMSQGGSNVPVSIISRTDNGYGDNTIVWEPTGLPTTLTTDRAYTVTVASISGAGVPTSRSYTVTVFDPAVLGDSVTISGTNTPSTAGASYTFNPIGQSDSYELSVAQISAEAWLEGAEDSPTPQITSSTTGSYALRQTTVKRTGSKAFQLAFPDFNDQSFVIARDLVPTATSALVFYDLGRFATTTTTLGAEISTDNGTTWANLWSRNGVGLSSALWDSAFISRNISLASYAGQIVRLRFILRGNGASVVLSATQNDGFFLDDISVTNATQLVSPTTTSLAGNATSFTLNGTTAGTTYVLRIRPQVGLRFYGFGTAKTVTAQAPTGYSGWVQTQYPAVVGGVNGDHDNDGLKNGVEYAFGLNPLVINSMAALPQPAFAGGNFVVSYTQPAGVSGVVYAMQSSTDLVQWMTVPDSGSGNLHTFSVSANGVPRVFFRHRVTITP